MLWNNVWASCELLRLVYKVLSGPTAQPKRRLSLFHQYQYLMQTLFASFYVRVLFESQAINKSSKGFHSNFIMFEDTSML